MSKYRISKILGSYKQIELISGYLLSAIGIILTILGFVKIIGIPVEVIVTHQLLLILSIVLVLGLAIFIFFRVKVSAYLKKWENINKLINEQLKDQIKTLQDTTQDPITNSYPRDARIDYALAFSILSELDTRPILRLFLTPFSFKDELLKKVNSQRTRLYLVNPGMFKTYVIVKDENGDNELFLVDCTKTNAYERDYALTLYTLIIPILSSVSMSISQIYSDDVQVQLNGVPDICYFYYINDFKKQQFIDVPMINKVKDMYKFILSYEIGISARNNESPVDYIKRVKTINKLSFQISKTESGIVYETQPKKKFEYNERLRKYKKDLEELMRMDKKHGRKIRNDEQ
jgi:hypothetical protein